MTLYTSLSEKTENKYKAKPAFGPYQRSQTCSHVHEEIIKVWLLFVWCSSGAPLWRSLKGLLSFRVCVARSLPLCAPPLFLSLCMCAVVLEAKALIYIKGWLFTTEISGRNYSHIHQYVFSQRWTRQNCDSSQLHDAQALAWTLKSAIGSCSDKQSWKWCASGEWIVQRGAARVWSVCIKARLSICTGVGVDLRDTETTERQPRSILRAKSEPYDNGGVHHGGRIHTELLRWRDRSSACVVSKMRWCRAAWIKRSESVFFFCAYTKECWGLLQEVRKLLDNIESVNTMASRP